jgi:hypothetical protein
MTPTFLAGRPAKARPLDSGFPRRQVRNHTVALRRAVRLRVSDASTPSGGRPGLTSLGGPHPTRRPTSGLGSATPALVAVELAVADPYPTPRDLARPVFKPNLAQGVGYRPLPTPSDRPQSLCSSQTWLTGSGIAPYPSPLNRAQSLCSSQIRPGGAEILLAPKSDVLPVAFQGMRTKRPASLQAGLRLARHTQGGVPPHPRAGSARHGVPLGTRSHTSTAQAAVTA